MRSSSDTVALWALVISNLLLLALALFYRWSYYAPLLIFWCETIIIGLYNVVKMFVVGVAGNPFGRWIGFENVFSAVIFVAIMVTFFIFKFGGVVLGAGLLALILPAILEPDAGAPAVLDALDASGEAITYGVALLAVSHGISFVRNFMMKREYQRTNLVTLLFWPYLRSLWLGLTIVAGIVAGTLVPGVDRTIVFVALIVVIKLAGDLASHVLEHAWLGVGDVRAQASRNA